LIFAVSLPSDALSLILRKTIEQKKKETKAQNCRVERREKLEINRLYKNQITEVEHRNLPHQRTTFNNQSKIERSGIRFAYSIQSRSMEYKAAQRIRTLYKGLISRFAFVV
jgi:hypothetical protein